MGRHYVSRLGAPPKYDIDSPTGTKKGARWHPFHFKPESELQLHFCTEVTRPIGRAKRPSTWRIGWRRIRRRSCDNIRTRVQEVHQIGFIRQVLAEQGDRPISKALT